MGGTRYVCGLGLLLPSFGDLRVLCVFPPYTPGSQDGRCTDFDQWLVYAIPRAESPLQDGASSFKPRYPHGQGSRSGLKYMTTWRCSRGSYQTQSKVVGSLGWSHRIQPVL